MVGGILETLNIVLENFLPPSFRSPAVPLSSMAILFASWGVAGFLTARRLGSFRSGLIAAICSAGICMTLGVAVGFAVQIFIARQNPAEVSNWAEYKRSGWTDPRAFALADTLDSALTHLVMAPLVGLGVSAVTSYLGRMNYREKVKSSSS